jgi:gamma-glutamyl hercynylcysteine S-oxide hydrolase
VEGCSGANATGGEAHSTAAATSTGKCADSAKVVASEPYDDDDPRWVDDPDRHLLELTTSGMSLTPLEHTS